MARILIVEDNPDNMKLFRAILAMNGHEVTALPTGEGLLDTLERTQPELTDSRFLQKSGLRRGLRHGWWL